ncbi:CLUMA_CG000383, isoform A [Clunio marinus]|uniref:CLUMA_CG000383, isoform A n=1 Tax=Clunio marinus TaxID=568069 RepID=A0A1J1HEN1_9DIPT|nr:CLUMA_CG000383, isoform A [Clunio marinus]
MENPLCLPTGLGIFIIFLVVVTTAAEHTKNLTIKTTNWRWNNFENVVHTSRNSRKYQKRKIMKRHQKTKVFEEKSNSHYAKLFLVSER